jgi:hypothetical protein
MSTDGINAQASDSALVSWVIALIANASNAWRNSATRSILLRHIAPERSDARLFERIGFMLLAASVTHAALLWMAPIYARPFYGVTGAAAMSVVAIALIAVRRGRKPTSKKDDASPPARASV